MPAPIQTTFSDEQRTAFVFPRGQEFAAVVQIPGRRAVPCGLFPTRDEAQAVADSRAAAMLAEPPIQMESQSCRT